MNSWRLHWILVLFVLLASAAPGSARAADSFEPNDTPDVAHVITDSGQPNESWISRADDEDWYRFEHASEGELQIALSSLPFDYDMELWIFVPPSTIDLVDVSENPDQQDESIVLTAPAGEYFIHIYPFDGFSDTDSYFLTATFAGGGGGNTAPQVTVNSPNGGESFAAGSNQTISYTATDAEQGSALGIDIELSTDGGATWNALATGASNTGSFPWTVPNVATTQARVRVTANDGQLTGSDVSNGNFTITTAPTGSNSLAVTDGTGASGSTVTVELTLDNDDTVKAIQTDLLFDPAVLRLTRFEASGRAALFEDSSAVVFDGCVRVVVWSTTSAVVTPGSGAVAQIDFELIGSGGTSSDVTPSATVISDQNGQAVNVTTSAGEITVTQGTTPPAITLQSPNGGESFPVSSNQSITWTASGGAGPLTISIDLSTDGGASFSPVTSGLSNSGSFAWTVPNLPTSQGRIRVTASDGQAQASDTSNGNFTIAASAPLVVTVISPNGGESMQAGTLRTINWAASGGTGTITISIDFSSNGGASFSSVATGIANSGSHSWSVPNTPTTQGRIRVTAADAQTQANDTSDANFTITAAPTGNVVSLGSASGESGTTVTVPLRLDNEAAVKALQLDISFDPSVASFLDASVAERGLAAGLSDSTGTVSNGLARVVLFARGNQTLSAGTGTVANLSFQLRGSANQTTLSPSNLVLSDPNAQSLTVTGQPGVLTVTGGGGGGNEPRVDIAVLQNPGRTRTLQIFVTVERGSGAAPTLTVAGSSVTLAPLAAGVFQATFFAPQSASSVVISASDTTSEGTGTDQVTVTF
jgi:hypothetical protein